MQHAAVELLPRALLEAVTLQLCCLLKPALPLGAERKQTETSSRPCQWRLARIPLAACGEISAALPGTGRSRSWLPCSSLHLYQAQLITGHAHQKEFELGCASFAATSLLHTGRSLLCESHCVVALAWPMLPERLRVPVHKASRAVSS